MIEETTKYGHKYLSPSALVYGDYGGAGSVGVANVRAILNDDEFKDSIFHAGYSQWDRIGTEYEWKPQPDRPYRGTDDGDIFDCKEPPKVVHLTGGYGSNTIWLLECEETEDIIACLADYPLLDDDLHSQVEMEWEAEAWDSWTRAELYDGLPEELQDKVDNVEDDTKLFEAYRQAMEDTNTYPVPEHDGVYIDTKRIQDAYTEAIAELMEGAK